MIIALGKDKKISESGSLEQLRGLGGYVQQLLSGREGDPNDDIRAAEESKESADIRTPPEEKITTAAEEREDKRRQVGDWTVYRYYFGSVGFFTTLAFALAGLIWAVLSTFPSKLANFALYTLSGANLPQPSG